MSTEFVTVEQINNQIIVSTQTEAVNNTATLIDQQPRSVSITSSNFVFPTGSYAPSNHIHSSADIIDLVDVILDTAPVSNILSSDGINVNSINRIFTPTLSLSLISCGRLTLTSGDPLGTSDTTSSTIYYSPYNGDMISLYDIDSSSWKLYQFNELSMVLSGLITNTNYDIFLYNNNGLTLEKIAWSNNTTRSVNLTYLDGVFVKNTEQNKKYLGTFRATNSSSTTDTIHRRFLYNHNNKIDKILYCNDTTVHTYTNATIRPYRNITTIGSTRVEFINGLQNQLVRLICLSSFVTENQGSSVGIGLDSITVINTDAINSTYISGPSPLNLSESSIDFINPSIGYHYLQLLQSGSSVSTFGSASMKVILSC